MDKDLLYNFYKGNVSIEEGQRVKAWVEASDENERAFYRERKIFDALMLNNPLPVKKTSFFNFTHYKKIEWLKIAMTVILTFLLSYFYQEYKAGLDSVAMSTISVPEGQRTNVTLPDGSNVCDESAFKVTLTLPCINVVSNFSVSGYASTLNFVPNTSML